MALLVPLLGLGLILLTTYIYNEFKYLKPFRSERDRRKDIIKSQERGLEQSLREDKGGGCYIPKLNPFAPEIMEFNKDEPQVVCNGSDWVKCYLDECSVTSETLQSTSDIKCLYYDIIYKTDRDHYVTSTFTEVSGNEAYILEASDYVKIKCTGTRAGFKSGWVGIGAGFRSTVVTPPSPHGKENTINVLMFGYDSTSRNGFIRKLPQSYAYLKNVLNATFLTSYSVVGDATTAALFALLTGKTELEWPEARSHLVKTFINHTNFIFHKLKQNGYRTAYLEDSPEMGTFQLRLTGFAQQPADHYLRDFFLEAGKIKNRANKYCVGDTPSYKLMMNVTEQFFKLEGKKYCFTMIGDISHDNFNMISSADTEFTSFLRHIKNDGVLQNTMLFVFGDHGRRFRRRQTYEIRMEERLPLMAIVLPEQLLLKRPKVESVLKSNADVLTTPFDIYATVLDAVDMREHWNPFKVKGADLPRGMTLFETIPGNRSCSEAGIEIQWCACHRWVAVSETDPKYHRAVDSLIRHINGLTESNRKYCAVRKLTSVSYLSRAVPNSKMMSFMRTSGYIPRFNKTADKMKITIYKLQVDVSPGNETFEASMTYRQNKQKFEIDINDITRINPNGNQSHCIYKHLPYLNEFCYCNN